MSKEHSITGEQQMKAKCTGPIIGPTIIREGHKNMQPQQRDSHILRESSRQMSFETTGNLSVETVQRWDKWLELPRSIREISTLNSLTRRVRGISTKPSRKTKGHPGSLRSRHGKADEARNQPSK